MSYSIVLQGKTMATVQAEYQAWRLLSRMPEADYEVYRTGETKPLTPIAIIATAIAARRAA